MQKKPLICLILFIFLLTSCKTQTTDSAERWMTVDSYSGTVEVKSTGSDVWESVEPGQRIETGSSIRTSDLSNITVVTNDDAVFELGMNALVTVEEFSDTLAQPVITLLLEEGGLLIATSNEALMNDTFTVKTADLSVSLSPIAAAMKIDAFALPVRRLGGGRGSLVVGIQKGVSPKDAATKVGVVQGNGTVTFPEGNTKIISDLESGVVYNRFTEEIKVYSASLLEEAREMGITHLDVFFNFTPTPDPSKNAAKTTVTPTVYMTWTPFPDFETPTITPTPNPLPTHRATPSTVIGADGLTEAETANAGAHAYTGYGIAYGDCTFSGAEAEDIGSITFTRDQVTIEPIQGSGGISYPKISPNIYRIGQNGMTATITFFIDGWDLEVLKGGQACSHQTFILK